jgi:hypothetical protein
MWRFSLMSAGAKTAQWTGSSDIAEDIPDFLQRFQGAAIPSRGGIDEAGAITDCPADSIGSFV